MRGEVRIAPGGARLRSFNRASGQYRLVPRLRPSSRSKVFPRPGEIRSGTFQRREQAQHRPVYVYAVWPRPPEMYRQSFRVDGNQDSDRLHAAQIPYQTDGKDESVDRVQQDEFLVNT